VSKRNDTKIRDQKEARLTIDGLSAVLAAGGGCTEKTPQTPNKNERWHDYSACLMCGQAQVPLVTPLSKYKSQ